MNERVSDHQRMRLSNALRAVAFSALALGCGSGDPIGPTGGGGGTASALLMVTGDAQNGTVSTQLAADFVVRVNDQTGNPLPGITVNWAVTAGGGSITPTSDVTDGSGLSQSRLTLGASPGVNTATASVTGLGSVTFNATAVSGGGGGGGGGVPVGPIVFRTIDAGSYHTCGITQTEIGYCWGFNQDGEVGNGTTALALSPAGVSGGLAFRQIYGGRYHSCGVTLAGDGYCWGSNLEGQLGREETPFQSSIPVLNGRAITFGSISVGRSHTCGLALTGDALCWGSNVGGQLGFFTETSSVDTTGWVRTNEYFSRIAAGGLHNCGLVAFASTSPEGTALCWGFNDQGQLGTGNTITIYPDTTNLSTRLVSGGLVFDSITAGYKHTCALTAAGVAYCWGNNAYGQLGDGTTARSLVPVAVSGGLTFVALNAGYYHTCGITNTGAAYCWGRNSPTSIQESVGGQIGDGTTTDRSVPTLVSGALTFQSISSGEVTTCGVTTGGVAYCWGDNEYGQLGSGATAAFLVPTKVSGQP
jgi:alpha-tubulin suppressor-like RCC1 family protein